MNMPTLEEIFYGMHGEEVTSPELDDEEQALRRFLKILRNQKEIDKPAARHIRNSAEAISVNAKCAGFELGFNFAVKLFLRRD